MRELTSLLTRIAEALERLAPPSSSAPDLASADAYVWNAATGALEPVAKVSHVELALLKGIDRQIEILTCNTRQFAEGKPANNALLWGAKGTGKSSLVKAIHAELNRERSGALVLVEIPREDIGTLPRLLPLRAASDRRVVLFCDDLSFEGGDQDYKSLKALLDGGIRGRPDNVLLYATSNRRHLMARDMVDNERSTAINPSEAVDEKVSLSDRFGLWLGFHNLDQAIYLDIVEGYARDLGITIDPGALARQANEWSITRGARSGRVAWQFVQDLAGRPSN
jgi:predicted AAA+ superfamily ATPase